MKTSILASIVLLALAGGCKKSSSGGAKTAAATPATDVCAQAGAKIGTLLETELAAGDVPDDKKEKLKPMFAKISGMMEKHCKEDPWPSTFTECVVTKKSAKDMNQCELPEELEQKIAKDMEVLMPEIMAIMATGQE